MLQIQFHLMDLIETDLGAAEEVEVGEEEVEEGMLLCLYEFYFR